MSRTRTDSVLNTGLSSAAQRRLEAKREQGKKDRDIRRGQLTPGAEIVIAWIDKELAEAADLRKIVLNVESEENVRAQLLARQLHINFLNSIRNRAKNMLRSVAEAEKQTDAANPWAKVAGNE